ncbi:Transcriptional regulator, ArsR family [gamma proteobacterium HdN1]|nr:Transcriptional regulator, ArsR family [gamma proteobacterium HdN1]
MSSAPPAFDRIPLSAEVAETPLVSDIDRLAQCCKAAGEALRLEILRALRNDSFGVLELSEIFNVRQSGMSHHLKVLSKASLVSTRREGNSIFYRRALTDPCSPLGEFSKALFQAVDHTELSSTVHANIETVKSQRSEAAREFFNRIAEELNQQQELIVPPEHYLDSARAILDHCPPCTNGVALEIGPGDGRFLATLASRFQTVIALDISEEMLARAQHFCEQEQLDNIQFLRGDTHHAQQHLVEQKGIRADRIICNMVLHHVPSPADVFNDAAKLLNEGGSLIVTDLCRHTQHWARERCGDLWLGFEPEDLTDWACAAGLACQEELYLGLRNGFQVQVRRFDKLAIP